MNTVEPKSEGSASGYDSEMEVPETKFSKSFRIGDDVLQPRVFQNSNYTDFEGLEEGVVKGCRVLQGI